MFKEACVSVEKLPIFKWQQRSSMAPHFSFRVFEICSVLARSTSAFDAAASMVVVQKSVNEDDADEDEDEDEDEDDEDDDDDDDDDDAAGAATTTDAATGAATTDDINI